MKKFVLIFFSLFLVLSYSSCASNENKNPPKLSEVNDTFIRIIEESKEFNMIFFGEGLPTYKRDSDLSNVKHIYLQGGIYGFEYFMDNTEYYSIETIKEKANRVFGSNYLDGICESAFEGIYMNDSNVYLKYYEDSNWIYMNSEESPICITEERIYDYSSMKIVTPSSSNFVTVNIRSYIISKPNEWQEFDISFVYENGMWYLDSPTY